MDGKTLALYLGCECLIGDKEWKRPDIHPSDLSPDVDLDYGKPIRTTIDLHCIQHFAHKMTPILRPLSSMTEEEAIEIGDMVIGRFDSVKFRADKKTGSDGTFHYWRVHRDHRGYEKSLCIDGQGEVDVYEKSELCVWVGQHNVTLHLLSKGFDLFGLHDKGECLYQEDLK